MSIDIGSDAIVYICPAFDKSSGVLEVWITSSYTGGQVNFRILAETLPRIIDEMRTKALTAQAKPDGAQALAGRNEKAT